MVDSDGSVALIKGKLVVPSRVYADALAAYPTGSTHHGQRKKTLYQGRPQKENMYEDLDRTDSWSFQENVYVDLDRTKIRASRKT
ncbi:hypothetical protein CHS0354_001763, partial [Potamilus streckersoni]